MTTPINIPDKNRYRGYPVTPPSSFSPSSFTNPSFKSTPNSYDKGSESSPSSMSFSHSPSKITGKSPSISSYMPLILSETPKSGSQSSSLISSFSEELSASSRQKYLNTAREYEHFLLRIQRDNAIIGNIRRDNYIIPCLIGDCLFCKAFKPLEPGWILPKREGGLYERGNIYLICEDCADLQGEKNLLDFYHDLDYLDDMKFEVAQLHFGNIKLIY